MQDKLEDKYEDYCSIPRENWCDLLSTMKIKENNKRSAAHINRLATSKASPINSDSGDYIGVLRKKKASTGVLPSFKQYR